MAKDKNTQDEAEDLSTESTESTMSIMSNDPPPAEDNPFIKGSWKRK